MRDLNLKDVEDLVKCNHAKQIGPPSFLWIHMWFAIHNKV